MFEELSQTDPARRSSLTLFHVARRDRGSPRSSRCRHRESSLHYEHETSAGADVITAAGGAATALADPPSVAEASFAQAPVVNEH